jgi:hypothetical protein
MSRFRSMLLLAVALLFSCGPVLAASTFAVGTCKPGLPSYPTISAAVAAVPAGSTVIVCPGTYPEQITISQPLTLQGVSIGDSGQVIVTVPPAGLSMNTTSIRGTAIAAQVLVSAGPVNITNITVDGSGNNLNGSATLAGLFYGSGSSGLVNQVTTRNQINTGTEGVPLGVGIWAENGNSINDEVTIQSCSVHDFNEVGIIVVTNQTPSTLTTIIRGNNVSAATATSFIFGIVVKSAGSVTNNTVTGPGTVVFPQQGQGITGENASVTVSNNIVTSWDTGIVDFDGATITGNTVLNTVGAVVLLSASGGSANSNIIADTSLAIELDCVAHTAIHNTINDAGIGLNDVPSSFSSPNSFFNVQTIRSGGCAAATTALSEGTKSETHTPRRF